MAVRQYVGARYVPKFYQNSTDPSGTEWEGNRSYEALTVVSYNNDSYTSKIPVPAGIGNPASNPTYWARTGAYNAQVEQYRQQTITTEQNLNDQINTIKSDVSQEVEDRKNADNELNNNLTTETTARENDNKSKILLLGDSWTQVPAEGKNVPIATEIMSKYFDEVYNYGVGGATLNTLPTQITNAKNNMPDYAKNDPNLNVLVVIGVNDLWNTDTNSDTITSLASNAFTQLRAAFPKSNIMWVPSVARQKAKGDNDNYYENIANQCIINGGCVYYAPIYFIIQQDYIFWNTTSSIPAEHIVHLSTTGYEFFYNYIASAIGKHTTILGAYNTFTAPLHIADETELVENKCTVIYNTTTGEGVYNVRVRFANLDSDKTVTLSLDVSRSSNESKPFTLPFLASVPVYAGNTNGNHFTNAQTTATEINIEGKQGDLVYEFTIPCLARTFNFASYTPY